VIRLETQRQEQSATTPVPSILSSSFSNPLSASSSTPLKHTSSHHPKQVRVSKRPERAVCSQWQLSGRCVRQRGGTEKRWVENGCDARVVLQAADAIHPSVLLWVVLLFNGCGEDSLRLACHATTHSPTPPLTKHTHTHTHTNPSHLNDTNTSPSVLNTNAFLSAASPSPRPPTITGGPLAPQPSRHGAMSRLLLSAT